MKRRILSTALALGLVLGLGAPVLAAGETRLTGVSVYVDGELAIQYTYTYEDGPLPAVGRMHELTERTMVRNGQVVEEVPPDTVYTYAYDGADRLVRYEASIDDGTGYSTTHLWEYGEDGQLLRDSWTIDRANDGGGSNYIYDEAGRLIRSMDEDMYGIVRSVCEYDCDEAGRVTSDRLYDVMDWDETGEPTVWEPYLVSEMRFAYDEAGRTVYQANYYNGRLDQESYYTYEDDPYFTLRYGEIHDYMNNEIRNEFMVTPYDGRALSFTMPGTPKLTRDGAGRLIKAETENRYMEFSYAE